MLWGISFVMNLNAIKANSLSINTKYVGHRIAKKTISSLCVYNFRDLAPRSGNAIELQKSSRKLQHLTIAF